MTPEPSRPKVAGLLFGISTALLVAAGIVLALLLSRGGGGTEAGPGAGLLPTAPASVAVTATRTSATRPARAGAWPVGVTGYTVVIATLAKHGHPRAAAERLARTVQVPGLPARVLDSSRHPRLRPAVWIVYVGRYPTPAAAQRAARQLRAAGIRRGVVERLTG